MSFFTSQNSIGIYWDREGNCRGVRLEEHGHSFRVSKIWRAEFSDNDHSAVVGNALNALGADDATRLFLGGSDRSCTVCDVRLPRLSGENLRHALLFELRKQCPLPVEQLAWGYRVIPGSVQDNTQLIRLFYLRDDEWNRWVENALSLRRKVDAILSPAMALDPCFSQSAVQMPSGLIFGPCGVNGRLLVPAPPDDTPMLGAGDKPLEVPGLEAAALADMDADEQRAFVPAIVLAAGARTCDASRDRKSLPAYPQELVPKRNRLLRGIAAAAGLYLAVMLAILVGGALKSSLSYRMELRQRLAEAQKRIGQLEDLRDSGEVEKELKESLEQLAANMPTMTQVMAELTDLVPREYWTTKLSWNNGKVELEVNGSDTDFGFIQELEESSLLENVELTDKRTDARGNLVNARIRLYAEYLKNEDTGPSAETK